MRKYYIDYVRILCILLLFPFHTAMIFNGFGEDFYVHSKSNLVGADLINISTYPWWMSGLFVLAGMSTVYALRKRTIKEYVNERIFKLLIPLISSLILIIPVQPYIADKYFNGYEGSYIEHFKTFFSLTDWSGYDGHFTPGQTWFILYLFIISMALLPIIKWYKDKENKINQESMTMIKIIPMFLILLISKPILNIGNKSIGEFSICFLLGYFILSIEEVQEKLEKHCIKLGVAWITLMFIRWGIYFGGVTNSTLRSVIYEIFSWIGILAMIGLGKRFLDFDSKFRRYFVKAEFLIYILHQSILVVIGYFVLQFIDNAIVQYFLILVMSFVITIISYEVFRRVKFTRFLLAIKENNKNK